MILTLVALFLGQTPPESASSQAPPKEPPPPSVAKARIDADSPGELGAWLLNLARHQGHLVGRRDPRSASLHVLALLEAATTVDPNCAEAYYWLYDIQHRLGQSEKAAASLARYVELTPADDAARARSFELALEEKQTAEQRFQFVQDALKSGPLTPPYESELRYRLAKFHYEKRDSEKAGRQIEDALRLNPMNIAARELAYEMYGETEADLQRVEMALQLISINPTQARLIWGLGEFLDRLSLHRQAQEWFNRAIAVHRSSENTAIPASFWHTLAMSYVASEDWDKARTAADEAIKADPNLQVARLLRSNALAKLGKAAESRADLDAVAKAYESRFEEVIAGKSADEAAEMAWFYCYHKPDKDRALKLADVADSGPNPPPLARLAHAYALRANGKTDDAVAILQTLAGTDQMAALELAKIYADRSKKADAIGLLLKAAALQHSGIAFNLIKEQLGRLGETPPEPPVRPKIGAALERFHRDIFDFPRRPGDFLKFTMRLKEVSLPPLGPIDVVFRMENAAPFSITFGEGFMVRPLVALSAKVGGAQPVEFKDYLEVLLNSRSMLLPGDALEKTLAVDVGPFREHLIKSAATTLPIELTAMLDPVFRSGALTQGPGTIVAAPIAFERKGLDASPGAVGDLIKQAGAAESGQRIDAAEKIGALLAASEKSQLPGLPADELRAALARLVADKDWRVRAHAMAAASWSRMDAGLTAAAAPAVRDERPVVKLLAVRLFADQHGEKFRAVLEQLSQTDPTHFVRMIALSYLPEPPRAQAGGTSANTGATPQ
jgi:tetratricopeptide (TPR) repeat protein